MLCLETRGASTDLYMRGWGVAAARGAGVGRRHAPARPPSHLSDTAAGTWQAPGVLEPPIDRSEV
jgi:hypothetical protein